MKDRWYCFWCFVFGLVGAIFIFCIARYGSPEGAFEEALILMDTDSGKTLGLLCGCSILCALSIHSLVEFTFFKKNSDQTTAASDEPHPCASCPVRNACICDYSDSEELGCQGDYHCPEKVTHFEDPGAGSCS